jgi:hypothetical protein
MKRFLPAVLTAILLAGAACAGAPPPTAVASNDGAACTAPHGFTLTSASGDALANDADVGDVLVVKDPEKPGLAALSIRLRDDAGARVQRYTAAHVGEQVTVSVRERVVARPTVRDPIGASFLVTGSSEADVAEMRAALCQR